MVEENSKIWLAPNQYVVNTKLLFYARNTYFLSGHKPLDVLKHFVCWLSLNTSGVNVYFVSLVCLNEKSLVFPRIASFVDISL